MNARIRWLVVVADDSSLRPGLYPPVVVGVLRARRYLVSLLTLLAVLISIRISHCVKIDLSLYALLTSLVLYRQYFV